jgi:uncharacterized protein YecE (DUF72 family)
LAEYVDVGEIGSTFERPLKAEVAKLYVRMVEESPRFRFTALLGRQFTYERDVRAEAVAEWKNGYLPLLRGGRLGCVVMQFPWAYRFTAENREFLIQLRRTFHEFPLAAEFRHASWLCDEAVTTLIHYHVGFANVDQPEYFRAMPPSALLTSGVAAVRMHGRRRPEAFLSFDGQPGAQPWLYAAEQLEEWRTRIARLGSAAPETFVVVTNPIGGNSLVNALQLRDMLAGRDAVRLAPAELIRRFPGELAAFRSRKPVQSLLPELVRAVA